MYLAAQLSDEEGMKDAGDAVPRTIPDRSRDIWLCRSCAYSEPLFSCGLGNPFRVNRDRVAWEDLSSSPHCRDEAALSRALSRGSQSAVGEHKCCECEKWHNLRRIYETITDCRCHKSMVD